MEVLSIELINKIGFPTVVCIVLLYVIREMTRNHKETILEFKNSIDKNTQAMTELINKIDGSSK